MGQAHVYCRVQVGASINLFVDLIIVRRPDHEPLRLLRGLSWIEPPYDLPRWICERILMKLVFEKLFELDFQPCSLPHEPHSFWFQ